MRRLLIPLLLLASCARAPVPTPVTPTPPQVKVLNYSKVFNQSLLTASKTLIAVRDGGTLSVSTVHEAQDVLVGLFELDKRINMIILSPDPWPTQRMLIRVEIIASGAREAGRRLPPAVQIILESCLTLLNQILSAVEGS